VAAAVAAGALVVTGVPLAVVLGFSLYWLAFVAVPGMLVLVAVRPGYGRLAVFAVGSAVGYALEVLTWAAAAAAQLRGAFWLYPLAVAALTVPVLWRRARAGDPADPAPALGRVASWSVAGGVLAAVVPIVVWSSVASPWPITAPTSYTYDMWFQLGFAADALHHFPPQNPSVAGVPQQYHWFFYGHIAAAAQVTGIAVPWLVLRLYLVPMIAVAASLVAVAAHRFSGRPLAAPLALLCATVAGELALVNGTVYVAYGSFVHYVMYSPTYLYGLVYLCALIVLVGDQYSDGSRERDPRAWWRMWALITVLLAAGSGAKVVVPALTAGGIGLVAAFALLRRRRQLTGPLAGLILGGGVALVARWVLFGGASVARLDIFPHIVLWFTPPFRAVAASLDPAYDGWRRIPGALAQVAGVPLALAIVFAPAAGAVVLCRERRNRLVQVFLAGVFLAGFAISSLVFDSQHSEHWFFACGLPAVAIAGGWGTAELLGRSAGRVLFFVVLAGGSGVAVYAAALAHTMQPLPTEMLYRYAMFAVLALAAAAAAGLAAGRALGGRPVAAGVALLAVLFGACLARTPLQVTEPLRDAYGSGDLVRSVGQRTRPDMTPALTQALDWIRTRTSPDDVIAVNNHCLVQTSPTRCTDTRSFCYSALSERRYLVESWAYSDATYAKALREGTSQTRTPTPFPERTAANDRVFTDPSPANLAGLYDRYHVRYLLADLRPAYPGGAPYKPPAALGERADPVFRTADAAVYRLRPPPRS
jgi:hypothetical protein